MTEKLTREELAALEVGQTTVSRPLSVAMVICFLVLIFSVPLVQTLVSRSSGQESLLQALKGLAGSGREVAEPTAETIWQKNNRLLARMDSFEQTLEKTSFLRSLLLAPGQRLLLGLGYGNEKVYPGRQDWLFYRPDMDYLMGPGFLDPEQLRRREQGGKVWEKSPRPDPLSAIIDFKQQLAARGITLILMPTPIKASLHPERFAAGSWHPPLQNRSWEEFLSRLHEAGVVLFDPAPILNRERARKNKPVYLQTDTHWRPESMEAVARVLAQTVQRTVSLADGREEYSRRQVQVANRGDIDAMLRLPEKWEPYPREEVTIHQVLSRSRTLWQPSDRAEVLLLGDSFSNIYSLAGMGWGEGAGLGEQLSYFLGRPVDVLLQNDGGAHATREMLSRELARGRDRLAGKKVVIWQFAARELASGDWKKLGLRLEERPESDFYVPPAGSVHRVRAVVAAVSASPLPGTVPYKDNIITLHLVDMRGVEDGREYGQALVYAWGMRDNVLTDLARVRAGQEITLDLVDWDSVEGRYSSYRRTTLDDEMLELELPVWGEPVP